LQNTHDDTADTVDANNIFTSIGITP